MYCILPVNNARSNRVSPVIKYYCISVGYKAAYLIELNRLNSDVFVVSLKHF